MAKISKEQQQIDVAPMQITESLTRAEQYIENNQKTLTTIVAGILIAMAAVFAYFNYYIQPLEVEAQEQMWTAQKYFEADSFKLALNGDGNQLGFLDILDDYSATKAGNISNYYAGVSYLHLGQYDEAIEYLTSFSSGDMLVNTIAIGATGDAYMEKDEVEEAISYYLKAAGSSENDFTTPIYLQKAGVAYEMLEKYSDALEVYEQIKKDYKKSQEGRNIDKYITRAKLKSGK